MRVCVHDGKQAMQSHDLQTAEAEATAKRMCPSAGTRTTNVRATASLCAYHSGHSTACKDLWSKKKSEPHPTPHDIVIIVDASPNY